MYQILRRQQFGPSTFLWEVKAPDVARAARAGHFVMARIDEHAVDAGINLWAKSGEA